MDWLICILSSRDVLWPYRLNVFHFIWNFEYLISIFFSYISIWQCYRHQRHKKIVIYMKKKNIKEVVWYTTKYFRNSKRLIFYMNWKIFYLFYQLWHPHWWTPSNQCVIYILHVVELSVFFFSIYIFIFGMFFLVYKILDSKRLTPLIYPEILCLPKKKTSQAIQPTNRMMKKKIHTKTRYDIFLHPSSTHHNNIYILYICIHMYVYKRINTTIHPIQYKIYM